jgi:hypothetical protein
MHTCVMLWWMILTWLCWRYSRNLVILIVTRHTVKLVVYVIFVYFCGICGNVHITLWYRTRYLPKNYLWWWLCSFNYNSDICIYVNLWHWQCNTAGSRHITLRHYSWYSQNCEADGRGIHVLWDFGHGIRLSLRWCCLWYTHNSASMMVALMQL